MPVDFIYRDENGPEERVFAYPDDPAWHPPPGALFIDDLRRWRCVRRADSELEPIIHMPLHQEDDQC